MNLLKLENNKVTSLQLVKEINFFRGIQINLGTEINLKELRHDTLLNIIRDEFEEEISLQEILERKYLNRGREYPMFCLSVNQAKQILVRESKVVRKAVIKRLDELENKILVPSYQISDPIARAKAWIQEQEKNKNELEIKDQIIIEYKPKADYFDEILKSHSLLTISQIAKDYGLSGQALNKILHEEGVQYKQSDQWLLYVKHCVQGYTKSETVKYNDSQGVEKTKLHTKWKQKGRIMIHGLLEKRGIKANIDQEEMN